MARYIDADILLQHWVSLLGINTNACLSIETLKYDLDKMPTADVQEVKHGHWEYNALNDFKKYSLRCSLCSAEYIDNYDGYVDVDCFEYCPNCGAKMDEEVYDDEDTE
jgi:hypothetical protein